MVFFHCLEKRSKILARGDDVTDGGGMDPTVPSHLMQFYRRWNCREVDVRDEAEVDSSDRRHQSLI